MVRRYRGTEAMAGLSVGGGAIITKMQNGTVSLDPGSIAAATRGTITVTLSGAAVGDVVTLNPPALAAGLLYCGAAVTAADTVTVYLYNATGSPIDDAARSWTYQLTHYA